MAHPDTEKVPVTSQDHLTCVIKLIQPRLTPLQEICLDGESLDLCSILEAAINPSVQVTIRESCKITMCDNAQYLSDVIASGNVIYGINTGYGGSADVRSDDVASIQRSLIRHLNAGFGDKLASDVVRAAMLVRANSLCKGYSGVRPVIAQTLLDMLVHDIVPVVPKRGSISASGDLMPTSYIAACMMGRQDAKVVHKGVEKLVGEAFSEEQMEPVCFLTKEALGVVNAASLSASLGALVLYDANIAAVLTELATAMSVESLRGRVESFHPTTHECMPHPGQREAAHNIRHLLAGSKFVVSRLEMERPDECGVLKQDRYGLRTSAQWMAPVLETLLASVQRILVEVNGVSDNPLVDHRRRQILHGGNFQGISITTAMDQARQSLQLCGKLLFAQMSEILNWKYSEGLPPNLNGSSVDTDFGFKGTDTAMASYCSELDYLTPPLTNHVLSAEMHNQSVNSMALVSARVTADALDLLQMMLANIFRAQVQAVELRWLQDRIQDMLSDLVNNKSLSKALDSTIWPWYSFVFSPDKTFGRLYDQHIITNGVTRADFITSYSNHVISHLQELRDPETVASHLGKGTRELYLFIRRTLKIQFYDGTTPLDTSLETIYQSIKRREIYPVIIDAFKDIETFS